MDSLRFSFPNTCTIATPYNVTANKSVMLRLRGSIASIALLTNGSNMLATGDSIRFDLPIQLLCNILPVSPPINAVPYSISLTGMNLIRNNNSNVVGTLRFYNPQGNQYVTSNAYTFSISPILGAYLTTRMIDSFGASVLGDCNSIRFDTLGNLWWITGCDDGGSLFKLSTNGNVIPSGLYLYSNQYTLNNIFTDQYMTHFVNRAPYRHYVYDSLNNIIDSIAVGDVEVGNIQLDSCWNAIQIGAGCQSYNTYSSYYHINSSFPHPRFMSKKMSLPTGKYIVVANTGFIVVFNASTGAIVGDLKTSLPAAEITSLDFNTGGTVLYMTTGDNLYAFTMPSTTGNVNVAPLWTRAAYQVTGIMYRNNSIIGANFTNPVGYNNSGMPIANYNIDSFVKSNTNRYYSRAVTAAGNTHFFVAGNVEGDTIYYQGVKYSPKQNVLNNYNPGRAIIARYKLANGLAGKTEEEEITYYQPQTMPKFTATDLLVTVYPNPSTGKLKVAIQQPRAQACVVQVLNVLGQIVWEQQLIKHEQHIEIDLTSHAKGLYFLHVRNSIARSTSKIELVK